MFRKSLILLTATAILLPADGVFAASRDDSKPRNQQENSEREAPKGKPKSNGQTSKPKTQKTQTQRPRSESVKRPGTGGGAPIRDRRVAEPTRGGSEGRERSRDQSTRPTVTRDRAGEGRDTSRDRTVTTRQGGNRTVVTPAVRLRQGEDLVRTPRDNPGRSVTVERNVYHYNQDSRPHGGNDRNRNNDRNNDRDRDRDRGHDRDRDHRGDRHDDRNTHTYHYRDYDRDRYIYRHRPYTHYHHNRYHYGYWGPSVSFYFYRPYYYGDWPYYAGYWNARAAWFWFAPHGHYHYGDWCPGFDARYSVDLSAPADPYAYSPPDSGNVVGTIVGGLLGGIIGAELDGGRHRTGGAVIGAFVGAALGNAVTRPQGSVRSYGNVGAGTTYVPPRQVRTCLEYKLRGGTYVCSQWSVDYIYDDN